jgi:hydrogenase maturation protease
MKRNKTAVIGLGNELLADEGVGMHATRLLRERLKGKNIDLVEAGTCGMNLLHQFDEREKIIFIDAGNCGVKPGEFRRFHRDDVVSLKECKGHSLHEFDLIEFLDTAKKIRKNDIPDVVIYCIQPEEVRMSEKLSPVVNQTLPSLVDRIYHEVMQRSPGV